MKHFLTTTLFAALVMALTVGCKKKEDEPTPSNNEPTTFEEQVKKKWTVSSDDARVQRTSTSSADYTSFEFTDKGTYYIIKADKSFLKGNFTLHVGDSSITMDGLGVIYIDEITDTEITFRLVLTGAEEDPITVNAAPVAVVSNTTHTQNLVNKWSFKTRTKNGVPDAAINTAFSTGGYYLYIDMSEFGTYAVDTNVPGTPNSVGIWKWCTTNENSFSTSSDASVTPTCGTNSTVNVSFNANGDLVLTAMMNADVNVDTYVSLP
jgi:hypothetical protein